MLIQLAQDHGQHQGLDLARDLNQVSRNNNTAGIANTDAGTGLHRGVHAAAAILHAAGACTQRHLVS